MRICQIKQGKGSLWEGMKLKNSTVGFRDPRVTSYGGNQGACREKEEIRREM